MGRCARREQGVRGGAYRAEKQVARLERAGRAPLFDFAQSELRGARFGARSFGSAQDRPSLGMTKLRESEARKRVAGKKN